jgi:hypothetical protein
VIPSLVKPVLSRLENLAIFLSLCRKWAPSKFSHNFSIEYLLLKSITCSIKFPLALKLLITTTDAIQKTKIVYEAKLRATNEHEWQAARNDMDSTKGDSKAPFFFHRKTLNRSHGTGSESWQEIRNLFRECNTLGSTTFHLDYGI